VSNIWDPEEHEDSSFTSAEDLIKEGAAYKITNAVEDENQFNPGQKELRLYLQESDDPDGQEIMWRLRLPDEGKKVSKSSKFSRFLRSLTDLEFRPTGSGDFIGVEFVAHKEVETANFRNRENPDGPRVERAVTYVTASALGSAPPTGAAAAAAADDPELIDMVLDLSDGQVFSAILTAVANEPKLAPLRPRISNKALLNELIDEGRLTLEGRTYKRIEN